MTGWMKRSAALLILLPLNGPASPVDAALRTLLEGNQRFSSGKPLHPAQSLARLAETRQTQHPIAAVLGCPDSRVPPEIVFDQGLGDLFVVRDAGNVVDPDVLGSLEYAVDHLHVPLVLVLGHKGCGAVAAALKPEGQGHLLNLVTKIAGGLKTITEKDPARRFDQAIHANVLRWVREIAASRPILAERVRAGTIEVVGALYDLESGGVELLSPRRQTAASPPTK